MVGIYVKFENNYNIYLISDNGLEVILRYNHREIHSFSSIRKYLAVQGRNGNSRRYVVFVARSAFVKYYEDQ